MKPPLPNPHGAAQGFKPRRSSLRFLGALCSLSGMLILLAGVGLFAGNVYLHSRYNALTVSDVGAMLYERETPIEWGLALVLAGGLGWLLSAHRQHQKQERDT